MLCLYRDKETMVQTRSSSRASIGSLPSTPQPTSNGSAFAFKKPAPASALRKASAAMAMDENHSNGKAVSRRSVSANRQPPSSIVNGNSKVNGTHSKADEKPEADQAEKTHPMVRFCIDFID